MCIRDSIQEVRKEALTVDYILRMHHFFVEKAVRPWPYQPDQVCQLPLCTRLDSSLAMLVESLSYDMEQKEVDSLSTFSILGL